MVFLLVRAVGAKLGSERGQLYYMYLREVAERAGAQLDGAVQPRLYDACMPACLELP
jgi:hypothetical protein